ncbi:hypothetical protein M0R04_08695 [Candidatus Dojkabacteria bacterium]|nr:hypothetical protein [Candidatus Dojkabacteria bacterium]
MENEKETIEEAIKEIHFCIQVLQEGLDKINNDISREVVKKYVQRMSKEEDNWTDYLESVYPNDAVYDLTDYKEDGKCQQHIS